MSPPSKTERALWCDRVRHALRAGERQPCVICGQHVAVSHAHHMAPVSLQHDAGILEPIHAHAWLCPSHHSLVHLCLEAALRGERAEGVDASERAAVADLALQGLGLMLRQLIDQRQAREPAPSAEQPGGKP